MPTLCKDNLVRRLRLGQGDSVTNLDDRRKSDELGPSPFGKYVVQYVQSRDLHSAVVEAVSASRIRRYTSSSQSCLEGLNMHLLVICDVAGHRLANVTCQ